MDEVDGFNKNDYPLHSIPIAEWEGFIFINFSDKSQLFDEYIAPLIKRFSNWNISNLIPLETKSYEVDGNWKLVIQN